MKNLTYTMYMPKLSCIVVNFNKAELTISCIKALIKALQNISAEIIIVDNGSSEVCIEQIKSVFKHIININTEKGIININNITNINIYTDDIPNVILIQLNKNYGFAKANNIGMSIARGKYILLINNDAYITKENLNKLIYFIENNQKVGMVAPKVVWPDGTVQYTAGKSHNFWVLWGRIFKVGSLIRLVNKNIWSKFFQSTNNHISSNIAKQVEVISGVCILLRREVFLQTGGFDEKFFMYLEDIDWADRVREKGWEIWYLPFASIVHLGGASSGGSFRDVQWESYKSLLYYFFKRRGKKGLLTAKTIILIGMTFRLSFNILYSLISPNNHIKCRQLLKILRQTLNYRVESNEI